MDVIEPQSFLPVSRCRWYEYDARRLPCTVNAFCVLIGLLVSARAQACVFAFVLLLVPVAVGFVLWRLRHYAWYPYAWAATAITLGTWIVAGTSFFVRMVYRAPPRRYNPGPDPGPLPLHFLLMVLLMIFAVYFLLPVLCAPPPLRAWRKTSLRLFAIGALIVCLMTWWLTDSLALRYFSQMT